MLIVTTVLQPAEDADAILEGSTFEDHQWSQMHRN